MSTYNLKINQLERERDLWMDHYELLYEDWAKLVIKDALTYSEKQHLELAGLMMQDLMEIVQEECAAPSRKQP